MEYISINKLRIHTVLVWLVMCCMNVKSNCSFSRGAPSQFFSAICSFILCLLVTLEHVSMFLCGYVYDYALSPDIKQNIANKLSHYDVLELFSKVIVSNVIICNEQDKAFIYIRSTCI